MLRDVIFTHPEYLLAGCIAWIVVTAWSLMLIHRMVMGDIDVLSGVIAIFTVIGLGFMAIHPPKPFLQPLSIGMLYLSGLMIPVVKAISSGREKRGFDIDAIKQAYEGFVLRPNNPPAQIRLARHLYNLGVRGHAMVLAEAALPQLPRNYFPDEHRMVEQWRRTPIPQALFEPINCIECGTANAPGTIHCIKCGSRYLLDRARGKSMPKEFARRLLAAWVVSMLSLVGIPLATTLAPGPALAVIIGLIILSVASLVMAFRTGDAAG